MIPGVMSPTDSDFFWANMCSRSTIALLPKGMGICIHPTVLQYQY